MIKIALVTVGLLSLCALIATLAYQNGRIENLMASDESHAQEVKKLSERVGKYTYNPHSLGECLNTAATAYTDYIKSHGKIDSMANGEPSYILSKDGWDVADTKLQSDRQNCEALFGKE